MSWSLSASGHADDPEQELILARALGQALRNAGSAVSSVSFGGSAYSGDIRELGEDVTA
jgi:hypothetical protein